MFNFIDVFNVDEQAVWHRCTVNPIQEVKYLTVSFFSKSVLLLMY